MFYEAGNALSRSVWPRKTRNAFWWKTQLLSVDKETPQGVFEPFKLGPQK